MSTLIATNGNITNVNTGTIKDSTGNTTAINIDSSGRITTPARPSFFAYRTTSDQSDINYTSNTQVDFDATQHNIGNCYNTSTNKFTAPIDGVYQFNWTVRVANVTTAAYVYSALRKNDILHWGNNLYIYGNLEDPQAGSYQAPTAGAALQISAGDEIDVTLTVNSDSTSRIQNNGTFWSGFLIG